MDNAVANQVLRSRANEILSSLSGGRGLMPRAKNLIKQVAHQSGVTAALSRWTGPRAAVLIYHKVERRDRGPFGIPAIDVNQFARHLEHLAQNYEVMPLSRLADCLRKGQAPRRAAAITFDDGYRNNLLLAYPLLRRWRMPATVFVTTGLVGTRQWMWTHEVAEMGLRYGLGALAQAGGDRLFATILESDSPQAWRMEAALEYLVGLGPRRDEVLKRLRGAFPLAPDDENTFLSWDEVRALHAGGIEIGSHTVSHPILAELPAERIEQELRASSQAIADSVGERPQMFCYPHGSYNLQVKQIAQRHYRAAVTTLSGQNTPETDPLELRRIAAFSVAELSFELLRAR